MFFPALNKKCRLSRHYSDLPTKMNNQCNNIIVSVPENQERQFPGVHTYFSKKIGRTGKEGVVSLNIIVHSRAQQVGFESKI